MAEGTLEVTVYKEKKRKKKLKGKLITFQAEHLCFQRDLWCFSEFWKGFLMTAWSVFPVALSFSLSTSSC